MAKVDMNSILAQHRKTYTISMSIGDISLKHPSQSEISKILADIQAADPEILVKWDKISFYKDKLEKVGLSPEEKEHYRTLLENDTQVLDRMTMACIVEPKIRTTEELNALAGALTLEEWTQLEDMFSALITVRKPTVSEAALIMICKAYGIPLAGDLTGENMTVQQASALQYVAEEEAIQTKNMLDEMN